VAQVVECLLCKDEALNSNPSSKKKKSEIMPFAGKWMELEIIILSEIIQSHKDKHCMLFLICGS
jgi:hypothetical protein